MIIGGTGRTTGAVAGSLILMVFLEGLAVCARLDSRRLGGADGERAAGPGRAGADPVHPLSPAGHDGVAPMSRAPRGRGRAQELRGLQGARRRFVRGARRWTDRHRRHQRRGEKHAVCRRQRPAGRRRGSRELCRCRHHRVAPDAPRAARARPHVPGAARIRAPLGPRQLPGRGAPRLRRNAALGVHRLGTRAPRRADAASRGPTAGSNS